MTKITFTSNKDGLGSIDFKAPNTNTNHTLNLPNAGGTIHTSAATNDSTTMPTVGGDPIVASGSNSDGEWTRWAEGTQICRVSISISYATGSQLSGDWIFPIAFAGGPRVVHQMDSVSLSETSSWLTDQGLTSSQGIQSDRATLQQRRISGGADYTSGNTAVSRALAIGVWK